VVRWSGREGQDRRAGPHPAASRPADWRSNATMAPLVKGAFTSNSDIGHETVQDQPRSSQARDFVQAGSI
jgi:hypothetical protein